MGQWRINAGICDWLPQLQSHRGYWVGGAAQNSLASIRAAFQQSYGMVEFDVGLTKDHVVVLFHDDDFCGKPLGQFTFSELKSAIGNAASNVDANSNELLELTSLEEVLIWHKDQKKQLGESFRFKLNIEVKSKKIFDGNLEERVVELIRKHDCHNSVLISSFNPFSLYRIKRLHPELYRALLLKNGNESNFILNKMLFNFLCQPDVLHLYYLDFLKCPRDWLSKLRGVPMVFWTVNDLDDVKKLKKAFDDFQVSVGPNKKDKSFIGIISDSITP